MSAPAEVSRVDVLAVMDRYAKQLKWNQLDSTDAVQARAAVAELIAKAEAMADRIEFEGKEHELSHQYLDLRAALSRLTAEQEAKA